MDWGQALVVTKAIPDKSSVITKCNSTERSSYNVLDKFIIKILKIYFEHENWSLKFDLSEM